MTQTSPHTKATLSPKDEAFRNFSLHGSMWKVVLQVGTPLALYQSLNQVFKILDTMMASHISSASVSAVAYLSQINLMLSALGKGLAVGAGIKISLAYGKGDYKMVKERVSSLYILSILMGAAVLLGILPFTEQFLKMAGTPNELIAVGKQYFAVELVTMVITFMNNVYIAVERARGNSKRILYLNMIVIVVKLSLTAFFVYVLDGDLVMIAFASLASQVSLFIFALINSRDRDENAFGFSLKAVTARKEVVFPMVASGIPVIVEGMAFSFGKIVVNSMSTVYGALTVGALGVSNNIGGLTSNPQNGFQEGTASVISQNMGAGNCKRAIDAFKKTMCINIVIGIVFYAATIHYLDFISGLFDGNDEIFHGMIMEVYRFEALGAITLGINASVLALLYGLGKTRLTLAINFSRVFIFRIPVLWFLQKYTGFGSESVGIVMMVSNISVGIVAVIVAFFVIRRLKKNEEEEL